MIEKHVFSDNSKRNLISGLFPLIKSLSLFESKENILSNTIKDIENDLFNKTIDEATYLFINIKSEKPGFTILEDKDIKKIKLERVHIKIAPKNIAKVRFPKYSRSSLS